MGLALIWRPALPAAGLALAPLLLAAMLYWQWRRWRRRLGARRAWPLAAARSVTVALLVLAMLDPACRRELQDTARQRLLVLVDRSDSMRVADDGVATREARAEALVGLVRQALPPGVEMARWSFAAETWPEGAPAPAGAAPGTDIGGALLAAAEQEAQAAAVLLLTDGGDEPPQPLRLPRAPLVLAAIGSDPAGWRDVSVTELRVPSAVECGVTFPVEADLLARGHADASFRAGLENLEVALARARAGGNWEQLASSRADLRQGRAQVRFETRCDEPAVWRYRLTVAGAPAELSPLNNRRAATVEARREALDVLYFSRRLGADLKRLRQTLSGDQALTFTALYRTGGERYTVQAGEGVDVASLRQGLPADAAALRQFECLILGSFPSQLWTAGEMRTVLQYVEAGGGLIWLGGEESFDAGGYEASALAPLIPWRLGGGGALQRGDHPVTVPLAAADDPAVAGLRELLAQSEGETLTVAAMNLPGALAPGARVLLEAERPQGRAPLLVTQAYGRGRVYALASNTSWQWAGGHGVADTFYRRLWRQMTRAAAGASAGGRLLQVTWEGNALRPAGRTTAAVRVTEPEGVSLRATLADGGGSTALPLERGDETGLWRVALSFRGRGDYTFRLEALRGGEVAESYEKLLPVAPPAEEGTRLECRASDLKRLAERAGGACFEEAEAEGLIAAVTERMRRPRRFEQVSLISRGPWFALAVLLALLAEWMLRRRRQLV
ncbi:MAG: hypothetical protein PHR35_04785 [Kiritimatiellae bacterium]|nr:hypothetical protein [Kiritimatiellia bacterium]